MALAPAPPEAEIPVTGQLLLEEEAPETTPSALDEFAAEVSDGQAGVVRGVYVAGTLALRVHQQPETNPFYISLAPDAATQYRYAAYTNAIGLLAHNYLAGSSFFHLSVGQEVWIIYGDGARQGYVVTEVYRYQALQPNSRRSELADLASGEVLSSAQLYDRVYRGEHHVTFQTCIQENGVSTWGRLFVIARPAGGLTPPIEAEPAPAE
ncbi:MAG: hypothetical protein AAB658_04425 [Chloroflexota bacterium]